jgi:hypothetical protein
MSEKIDPDFTEESKALGYYPFVRISPLEWLTFKGLYGSEWVMNLFSRLRDPLRLHPDWAVSFAGAAAQLPADQLSAAEDVYALVTKTKKYRYRTDYLNQFNRFFFNETWPRIKSGNLDEFDEAVRGMILADFERWRVRLKARGDEIRDLHRKQAEKKKRRLEQEAAEKAARERKAAEAAKAAEEKAAAEAKAKAEAEKKAAESAAEKQRRQTLPRGPSPARKDPVIERKPAAASAKPSSGNVWRNPNPGQPVVVRKKTME